MQSTCYYCQILITLESSRQISEKRSNVKFNENPSSRRWVVACGRTDGQTDRHDEVICRLSQLRERALQLIRLLLWTTVNKPCAYQPRNKDVCWSGGSPIHAFLTSGLDDIRWQLQVRYFSPSSKGPCVRWTAQSYVFTVIEGQACWQVDPV